MYWMLSPLLILAAWLTITRIATVILIATGMSPDAARFQSWSAFTGTGYTTDESEETLRHPVRRRVIRWLMFLGHAGLAAFAGTLVIGLVRGGDDSLAKRVLLFSSGLLVLYVLSRIPAVDRYAEGLVRRILIRGSAVVAPADVSDHGGRLVTLPEGWVVSRLLVRVDTWLTSAPLGQLRLDDEGVRVLSVTRVAGGYDLAPGAATRLQADDSIVVHGPAERLVDLDRRPTGEPGDALHQLGVERLGELLKRDDDTA